MPASTNLFVRLITVEQNQENILLNLFIKEKNGTLKMRIMMNNMNWYGCLYCHTNLVNGKKYWGQTTKWENPNERWKNGSAYKNKTSIKNAIKKYGWDNFQHDIVTYCLDKETLDAAETYWIKATRSNEREFGYNLNKGGSGFGRMNKDVIYKRSKKRIGIKRPPFSEEHKQKISLSKKGNKNPMYGKKHDEEWKKSHSLKIKNKLRSIIEATNKITNEKIILTKTEDYDKYGFSYRSVSKCITGKEKSHKGYIFKRLIS